jgi:hypothetical protein
MTSNQRKDALREICKSVSSTKSKNNYLYMKYTVTTSDGSFENELCPKAFTVVWGMTVSRLKIIRQVYLY